MNIFIKKIFHNSGIYRYRFLGKAKVKYLLSNVSRTMNKKHLRLIFFEVRIRIRIRFFLDDRIRIRFFLEGRIRIRIRFFLDDRIRIRFFFIEGLIQIWIRINSTFPISIVLTFISKKVKGEFYQLGRIQIRIRVVF